MVSILWVAISSPVIQTIGKSSTYGVSQVLDLFLKGEKVYYYSVCGQMKVFLDRMNPLYGKMKDKDFYYADKKGEVKDLPAFSEAYELGKKI